MESFEINKMLGALLGTIFVVMTIGIVSDSIFQTPHLEQEGYAIEATEASAEGGGQAEAAQPITALIATADPAKGEAVFKKCVACHTAEQGGPNKTGPNLWGIVDRPVASHEGFAYSSALKDFSQGGTVKWDYEHLSQFIAAPKALVKGTAMTFAGVKKDEDRAAVIAYLRSLSDNPAPLPQ
jgi:cytochrome c